MHVFLASVLGFSLEQALESPLSRRLAENNEPCKQSCDEGHDRACDEQDSTGRWTLSCDIHPTTSCDDDCHYPPPPPRDPWMGASGTYPSPPPPPPPPDQELLEIAWIYFLVALLIFLCCACYSIYHYSYGSRNGRPSGSRDAREGIAYWCCCCLTCWRTGDWGPSAHWDQEERDARGVTNRDSNVPPVMLK